MSQSTGIMLFAGTVSFGNEWIQTGKPNFRIPVATLVAGLFLNGVERIYPKAGTGLAVIVLITVLVTPFQGKSPLGEALLVLPQPKK
jgi:hypothetical protein